MAVLNLSLRLEYGKLGGYKVKSSLKLFKKNLHNWISSDLQISPSNSSFPLETVPLIYKDFCLWFLYQEVERWGQWDLHFQHAPSALFDPRYSVPQGISSILIFLVSHPLAGTTALTSRLKKKSISCVLQRWKVVMRLLVTESTLSFTMWHLLSLCINLNEWRNKNQYFCISFHKRIICFR